MKEKAVFVLAMVVLSVITPCAADFISLIPSDDAEVNNDNPGTNYGSAHSVHYGFGYGYERRGLLKFNFSSIPSKVTINSATLYLDGTGGYLPRGVNLHIQRLTDDSWSENTVTWGSQPGGSVTDLFTIDFDDIGDPFIVSLPTEPIEAEVNGDRQITIRFRADYYSDRAYSGFWSKEEEYSSRWPHLDIEYEVIPGTLSVTPGDNLNASGTRGGPFSPSSKSYTLTNTGGLLLSFSVTRTETWININGMGSFSGSLGPGADIPVTITINDNANGLSVGDYSDTVTFTNTTNGNGNTTRTVNLTIAPIMYTLSLDKTEEGKISANGTLHELPWSGTFPEESTVEIEAVPETGWKFNDWTGDVVGSTNPTTILVDANKYVTANFSLQTLTISGYIDTYADDGVAGVEVLANNGGGTDTTGSNGYYEVTVPYGWSGTLTPSKRYWSFDPSNRPYANVTVDQSNQYYKGVIIQGDFDYDGDIDLVDFADFAPHWMDAGCTEPNWCAGADIDRSTTVDWPDLDTLVSNWLENVFELEYFCNVPLNTDPGWISEGEWAFGVPGGGGGSSNGNPDPNSGYTGTNVYGVNLNGDYSTAVGGPYYLTAGPFECSGYVDIYMDFARWLNTDAPTYVASKIEASNNGTSWSVIWEHTGTTSITDDSWQILEYNISSIADNQDTVYIRWSYQILDDRAYPYSGWNIDDIQLWGTQL